MEIQDSDGLQSDFLKEFISSLDGIFCTKAAGYDFTMSLASLASKQVVRLLVFPV